MSETIGGILFVIIGTATIFLVAPWLIVIIEPIVRPFAKYAAWCNKKQLQWKYPGLFQDKKVKP